MFFRWLHKSWKYFWGILFSLLLIILFVAVATLGLLQLDTTQNYLADRIEEQIEQTYKADLSIGELDGFLPFQVNLHDVALVSKDSRTQDTVATVSQISSSIDVWGLLQNQVSITGFTVDRPRLWLHSNAEGRMMMLDRRIKAATSSGSAASERWFSQVEVVAPDVVVTNGAVFVTSATSNNTIANLPPQFSLQSINANIFVDWSGQQRYLDIESLTAEPQNLKTRQIKLSGQLYSDQRYLEFNSLYLTLDDSELTINGEIDGANIMEPNITEQMLAAEYNLSINSDQLFVDDFGDLFPNAPEVDTPLAVEFQAEGNTDSLFVDRAILEMGESVLNVNGVLRDLQNTKGFNYSARLNRLYLRNQELQQLLADTSNVSLRDLQNLTVTGRAEGGTDSLGVDLELESTLGAVQVQGYSRLQAPYQYQATLQGTNLDVSSFAASRLDTTSLNVIAQLQGEGITLEDAATTFSATLADSRINNIAFESLRLNSSLVNGRWEQEYNYRDGDESVNGSGWIDFSRVEPPVVMKGNAENIDLSKLFGELGIAESTLNFDYNLEMQGINPNRIQGRANLDVRPSVIAGDSVRAHQLYMDLNSPDADTRTFRLTSSLFDMNLTGRLIPGDIIDQATFWSSYLANRFKAEILMDAPADTQVTSISPPSENIVVDGSITAKDLGLIRKYMPSFPTVETDSRLSFNVNTDGTRLLLSAEMQADTLLYENMNFRNARSQFTASFRSDRSFSNFSSVDWETEIGAFETQSVDLDSMGVDLSVKRDSVHFSQYVGSISDNARFQMALNSAITDSAINIAVENFFMGNEQYAWVNEAMPSLRFLRNGDVDFNNFSFQNRNEYFRMQGTLSKNRSDSLTYILRDINLDRISALIKGQIGFAGVLNGTLVTRSLTRQPTIQGELNVNRFALNDRMIGDVRFDSKYNPDKERFDTQIDIVTDSTKYDNYLESNDDIGQNIRLDGYFVTPKPDVRQDTVYYFDADFRQIDMWVIPLVVTNIFTEMEGQASGEGYITGNLEDFDFSADFQTENVFAKPKFLNTNYFLSGHVGFDRDDGVLLDSVSVMDTKGGMGTVNGTIDLNDFNPITYLDLTLSMDRLQFLNNKLDPDVPFYGNVSGTGTVRLTGSNRDLYMRTESPVQVTGSSEVSIPLLEETELEETGQFIRFVDSFDNFGKSTSVSGNGNGQQLAGEEQLQQVIESMTFSERFDLDLQFETSNDITVNLIFDPVTGEILTAQGAGQMRITMQDQDVQIFGRYNINDGSYQFVTGEIISRRLELEPGGTIIWEGPADNARLDISAVYNARPRISTLISNGGSEATDPGDAKRVPIDLIVEINGTLSSVENNYYFRLPTSLDLSSGSTLQYTINQINRDEQQKLLQATSILFTGQFIPTQGAGSGTASLSESLTQRSTVLNPLLSNQVISPLLSNQINALLNSDVSRLDIDFNLNSYNQVDLGIALRLYNDRLILRREGQITGGGTQSTLEDRIGDLNATYRIRRGLSLTAFHRQDQVLNSLRTAGSQAGDVTPTVDGIGLEGQLQFNTWQELLDKIGRTFRSLFGRKNEASNKRNNDDKLADQEAKEEQN